MTHIKRWSIHADDDLVKFMGSLSFDSYQLRLFAVIVDPKTAPFLNWPLKAATKSAIDELNG